MAGANIEADPAVNEPFWRELEDEFCIVIKAHIKNIFNIQGLHTLRNVETNDIDNLFDNIGAFVSGEIYALGIPINAMLQNYYGHYYINPQNFRLSVGERILIRKMIRIIKQRNM